MSELVEVCPPLFCTVFLLICKKNINQATKKLKYFEHINEVFH